MELHHLATPALKFNKLFLPGSLGGKITYDSKRATKAVVGVDFAGIKVTNSDLVTLAKLPQLRELDLSGTRIDDAGLGHLKGLPTLDKLIIADTTITERGVAELVKARSWLRVSRRPRSLSYFPDGVFNPTPFDHLVDSYSEHLFTMNEPSLSGLVREEPKAVGYRFLWLPPASDRPLAVRIIPARDGAVLHAVQLDGKVGYGGGKLIERRAIHLSPKQWEDFEHQLNDANFWSMPTDLWKAGGADGSAYVLEGIKSGKYHAVNSCTNHELDEMHKKYKSLCETMIRLANMDLVDKWREN